MRQRRHTTPRTGVVLAGAATLAFQWMKDSLHLCPPTSVFDEGDVVTNFICFATLSCFYCNNLCVHKTNVNSILKITDVVDFVDV